MNIRRKVYLGSSEALANNRQVRVVCSTDELDRAGDVVVQEGIDVAAYRNNPVVLWQHNPDEPVARAAEIGVQDGKLQALVQFPAEGVSDTSDKCYGLIKAGIVNATSIGFLPVEDEPMDAKEPWAGRRFVKSELMEFSFVSVPANRGAIVVARNAKRASLATAKGLYEVGLLASLLQGLGYLQDVATDEAEREGDNSQVPAMLLEAMQSLGEALLAMTAEEISELLALAGSDGDMPNGDDDDGDMMLQRLKAFRRGRKAGRVLSGANIKRLSDAMGHHAQLGTLLKAVLDDAAEDPEDPDAAEDPEPVDDDPEKALRARIAESLALAIV